jgi:hypothetical protein
LAGSVRAAVHAVQPDPPVEGLQTMGGLMFQSLASRRFTLLLVGSLGPRLSSIRVPLPLRRSWAWTFLSFPYFLWARHAGNWGHPWEFSFLGGGPI